MSDRCLVVADNRKECRHARTCRKFASTKLLVGLNAGFTVGENATFLCNCTMIGLKCLVAVAMDNASTSHGSHVAWDPLSLALKNPVSRSLLSCITYKVELIPGFLTSLSVTIHS